MRYGSLNLAPTVGVVNPNQPVPKDIWITRLSTPPDIKLDAVTSIGEVFELCVTRDQRTSGLRLGSHVTFTLVNPSPLTGAPGSAVPFWQDVFMTYFVRPLQDTPTDANGVIKVDVQALALRSQIQNAPPGYSSGNGRIVILLSDGPHELVIGLALL